MSEPAERQGASATEWLSLQPPIWVPFLWWAMLVGSIIANMNGEAGPACSVEAPCEPEAITPVVVALVVLSAGTLWWFPITGLAAGAAYGALMALFDGTPGRYAGALAATVALGLLLFIRALRAQQAHVAASNTTTGGPTRTTPPAERTTTSRLGLSSRAALGAGTLGLLLLSGSLAAYVHETREENAHLDRAHTVQARAITGTDNDFRQVFEIETGDRVGEQLPIEVVAEPLPRGSVWPVLLDPADPTWARLVSEPNDETFWFGWAAIGGCTALWCLAFLAMRRRSRFPREPVLALEVDLRDDSAALILPPSRRPVAMVSLSGHPPSGRFGRVHPAIVGGTVADGSWVSLECNGELLPVDGPVRAVDLWREVMLPGPLSGDRANAGWERLLGAAFMLWHGFLLALGASAIVYGSMLAGPAWAAAHGRGVPGSLTVTSESCGKSCDYYGDFRSDNGRYVFKDVNLIGDSGPVGSKVPAYYEGDDPNPAEVYGHGWGGVASAGTFLGAGLFLAGPSLLRLLDSFTKRGRPSTGRHAAPPE